MLDVAVCLGLFLPLISFLLLMFTSNKINRHLTGIIGCGSIFISFLCFVFLLVEYNLNIDLHEIRLYSWIPIQGINADFSLHLDSLSLLMTLIISGVGFLIHVYSVGYMDHDKDFARYFASLNFFVFAMLLLVLGGNLLVLFIGWEGVGLASYLLIGFWYEKPVAAQAATKAFVVNRIGDLGLLLGIILSLTIFGTGDINEINSRASSVFTYGAPLVTILTLLFFFGATGKSAQLPLHTWLPDAMAGPTPVSALIHAATMVTAGVYLVVRLHPLFLLAPMTMQIVGIVGAATALYAALCALGQTDLKRVLAYSTVSQLGFMFMACGAGAFYAAMFHLTTHAFVKALLFLSAGNVVHMMHGETEMSAMGGLANRFPKTHWLFLIGALALSGVPPLAAFFSKDLILEQEYVINYHALFIVGLITSVLTAFYLIRAYCLVFTGKELSQHLHGVKEAPNIMLFPVSLLAILTILGGFLGFSFGKTPVLEDFLEESDVHLAVEEPPLGLEFLTSPETLMSIGGALLGIVAAVLAYTKYRDRLGSTWMWLKRSFYVDELYAMLFVNPLKWVSQMIGAVMEPRVFDHSIELVSATALNSARLLQQVQSGQLRSYVAWLVIGTVFVVGYIALR